MPLQEILDQLVRDSGLSQDRLASLKQQIASAVPRAACEDDQGWLSLGDPRLTSDSSQPMMGRRLLWWPNGVPHESTMGIVSSRLGRELEIHREWFRAIRSVCARCAETDERLTFQEATFAGVYVARAAELFDAKTLQIQLPQRAESLDKWLARILAIIPIRNSTVTSREQVFISPLVDSTDDDGRSPKLPCQDVAVFALSQRLCAVHVRPQGNIHDALLGRLQADNWPPASVHLHLNDRLLNSNLRDELLNAGAVGWAMIDDDESPELGQRSQATQTVGPVSIPLGNADEFADFVTHCTRRRDGPWPDQSEVEFLDDLILDRPEANHSSLASLRRIIERQELLAGIATIRGETPMVSFTEVSPPELHRLRVFRPHRGRWDFQPYGICIRRSWLSQRGSRPVQYADDETWKTLAPEEKPFFQKAVSQTKAGNIIHWTVEQEWRYAGDIDLSLLSEDDAIIFVPTEGEARSLAAISRWPIRLVSSKSLDCPPR